MRPVDLIGCGALNLDLIYRLPRSFPLWDELGPPGTEQLLVASVRKAVDEALAHVDPVRAGGGQAANTVNALARLGYPAAMIGRVGADDDGLFLLGELAPADARLVHREGDSGRVYVLLDEDGERRNLVWPGANDSFSTADVPRRLPRTRYALFTSFVGDAPLAAQLALLERLPADVEIAFDPGEIYARKGVKRFLPILRRCAYLFSTETELEMLCGLSLPESLDFLLNTGVGLVIVKMGGRGARLVGRRVDLYVPPLPAEVVDVTGAGDLFAAGFVAAMIEQVGLESAGRLAAWAASRGISGLGRSAYPDAEAWRERLAEERGEGDAAVTRRGGA
jgi:ribokinase